MSRCSGTGTGYIRLVPSFIVLACGVAGCLAGGSVADALDEEERATYRYELVQSANDLVCQHMRRVYNETFRQPWNFRDCFRGRLPETNGHYSPHLPGRWTEEQLFLWWMRYALYPTSREFEAIQWIRMTKAGPMRVPILLAPIDIDNDGSVELVVHDGFYGFGDGRNSGDGFAINADTHLLESNQTSLSQKELYSEWEQMETFSGDIIRPFVFNGVTYLSEYEAAFGSTTWPSFRHTAPEKMWVKEYVGGQPIGQAMNATVVCEFDMHRDDPSK